MNVFQNKTEWYILAKNVMQERKATNRQYMDKAFSGGVLKLVFYSDNVHQI